VTRDNRLAVHPAAGLVILGSAYSPPPAEFGVVDPLQPRSTSEQGRSVARLVME
jgi:hypothetical protein